MRKVLYLMGVLDDTDIDWLAANGHVQLIQAGDLLVEQGSPITYLSILLDGSLSVFRKERPDRVIQNLLAGEVIGEISFVDSRPPTASVQANTASYVLQVNRDTLSQKLAKDQAFAARFYRALALFLADRLRSTVQNLGFGDPNAQTEDAVELDDSLMDYVALGGIRFDKFLRQLRVGI